MSFFSLSNQIIFYRQVGETILNLSYSLGLFVEPLLHALQLGVGGVCLWHFSVSPSPLAWN